MEYFFCKQNHQINPKKWNYRRQRDQDVRRNETIILDQVKIFAGRNEKKLLCTQWRMEMAFVGQ